MHNQEPDHQGKLRSRARARSPLPNHASPYTPADKLQKQYPSSKFKWQNLVVGAGSAAGSTVAVISDESMKCLKYCLSWLQYAVQHIEQQMTLLRNYLVSLASNPSSDTTVSVRHESTRPALYAIKKEIVNTLRKVVEIISKYASKALPEQAKSAIRKSILDLPNRWAALNDIRSRATTPGASPMLGPNDANMAVDDAQPQGQEQVAIRLLQFGQESTEMLQSLSTVFSGSIDRAEAWLDRLRNVRIPAIGSNHGDDAKSGEEKIQLPPIRHALGMDESELSHLSPSSSHT